MQPPSDMSAKSSRRDFLVLATRLALKIAAAGIGVGALVATCARRTRGRTVVLGRFELGVGALVLIPEHELFLTRTERGLGAFSAKCTHLGCLLRQSGAGLQCPCHGATYDHEGTVKTGPARHDLPWYELSVGQGNMITVALDREVPRGTVTALAQKSRG